MAALLGHIVEDQRLIAQSRKITIEVTGDPAVHLQVDAGLISRVIENILDNPLRYTPSQGRIEVGAYTRDRSVEIRIGNTGPAIPPESRSHIFEKFGQVTPDAGRMNLGLYFCRLAMEAHGGKIWVEETTTLPTVFVMKLPTGA